MRAGGSQFQPGNLAAGNYSLTGTQLAGTSGAGVFRIDVAAVPVPAGIVLMLTGAAALGGLAARRKQTH